MTQANAVSGRPAGRPPLAMLSLMALPVFVLMGVGAGVALGVRGSDIQVLVLALITMAVAFVPLTLDFGRPPAQRHLLLLFVLLGYLAFFVVPVFTTYFFADFFLGRAEYDHLELKAIYPADIVVGQSAVLVGLLALLAGYTIPIGRLVPGGIPRPRRDWSYQSTLVVALITIPLGWAIYMSSQFGLLPKRAGSGFLGAFANSTHFGIALLMLAYLRHRSSSALALMALMIPPTMAFNYFTSSKALFFAPVAVSILAYIVVNRRIGAQWIIAAFVAMSLFYPVAEFQRQVILQGNTRSAAWALRKPIEVVTKTTRFIGNQEFGELFLRGIASTLTRFDGLGIASVIVRDCPARVPFQGGWTLAQIPLAYIPRILWKDKPDLTSGRWVTENFAGGPGINSSTGSTWIGELWFSYGWSGIVIGMFLMGIFLRVLYEMFFKPNAAMPALLMSVITLFMVPATLGGSVSAPVNGVIFSAMPIIIIHWIVRLMSGTLRPATARDQRSADRATEAHAGI